MSDTPRTDAAEGNGWNGDAWCVSPEFARNLERENASLRATLVEIAQMQDTWPNWDWRDLYECAQTMAKDALKEIL